jgi:hypothetical protein
VKDVPVIVTAAPVLFLSVTFLAALVVPVPSLPKAKVAGVTASGLSPFPVRFTLCGLVLALSISVRLAARAPLAKGVNVTLIEQLALGATVGPHVFAEMAKSPGFAPGRAALDMLRTPLPVFVTVTDCAALVVLVT